MREMLHEGILLTPKSLKTMDINKIIFSRTAPNKKVEIVENLTPKELLSVNSDTIKRMVKETGSNRYKSRDKELFISHVLRTGNNWNSQLESVGIYKGNLYVNLYVQYSNTDTTKTESFDKFFCKGDYQGSVIGSDYHGNDRHYYFSYDESDKARCMGRLLLQYLHIKYKDKL